jgi:hypothetical protein
MRISTNASRPLLAIALAALVALFGFQAAAPEPADAAEKIRRCIKKTKRTKPWEQLTVREFPTSGFNTDVELTLCIHYDYSEKGYWASATGHYSDGGGLRKFDRFDIRVGVQRNNRTVLANTDGYARVINATSSGPIQVWARYYRVPQSRKGTFTADARVIYDIDADGEGPKTWDMPGTKPIR